MTPLTPFSQLCKTTAHENSLCGTEGRVYLPGSSKSCLSLVKGHPSIPYHFRVNCNSFSPFVKLLKKPNPPLLMQCLFRAQRCRGNHSPYEFTLIRSEPRSSKVPSSVDKMKPMLKPRPALARLSTKQSSTAWRWDWVNLEKHWSGTKILLCLFCQIGYVLPNGRNLTLPS